MSPPDERGGSWTLLTGHGHVLVEIARNPQARMRDISAAAGITERTAQAIVADLEAAGYITRTRAGRRTRYTVNPDNPFRHRAQEGLRVGPFLDVLTDMADTDPPDGHGRPDPHKPAGHDTARPRHGAARPPSTPGRVSANDARAARAAH
jgi:MarR family